MIFPRNRLLIWVLCLLPFLAVVARETLALIVSPILFLALAGVAGWDAWRGRRQLRGLSVTYEGLARMTRGRSGAIRLRIARGESTVNRIELGLPLPMEFQSDWELYPVELASGTDAFLVDWPCVPSERGQFLLENCYFVSQSPWGFWNVKGVTECQGEVRSYPNLLSDRSQAAALFLRGGMLGAHLLRITGQGREFDQLREYMPGDGFDTIDWKATARRNAPITRTYQAERTQEVYIFLDLSRLSARRVSEDPVLETYINTSLLLGLTAEKQGDHFGLVTFSDQVHTFMKAGSGKAHYNACREALYLARPRKVNPDFENLFTFIRMRMRRRALLVFLTDLRDPVFAETFVQSSDMVSRQHLLLVNMIQEAGIQPLFENDEVATHQDMMRQLAGHMVWQGLKEVERELSVTGVTLTVSQEDGLTAEVLSQYMRVKQRQLL